ncbi:MAG: DNA invertase [Pseudomonas sp.]|nr:DNA invertase [Pseudomonas sp.]MBB61208.1 DNA invertase [Pseudomonas sp.]|tara:strand:- start:6244 stop:6816 length:573 start_codon:yes stop_codon:yes gene_type:complete
MSRTFAYCRVSSAEQLNSNQEGEILAAGFVVEPRRIISETISGSLSAMERPGFAKLLDRMEEGDVLVTTRLDRLGRNAMDVRATIDRLSDAGIRVHCLALGGMDLTSPAGKLAVALLSAVAEFERDLLIERTQAGLERARREGKRLGRPEAKETRTKVQRCKAAGQSQSQTALILGLSLRTVKRHWVIHE